MQLKQKLRASRHPLSDRLDEPHSLDIIDEDYLTRDEFNLHKMIVAVTMPAKVYCYMYSRIFQHGCIFF